MKTTSHEIRVDGVNCSVLIQWPIETTRAKISFRDKVWISPVLNGKTRWEQVGELETWFNAEVLPEIEKYTKGTQPFIKERRIVSRRFEY